MILVRLLAGAVRGFFSQALKAGFRGHVHSTLFRPLCGQGDTLGHDILARTDGTMSQVEPTIAYEYSKLAHLQVPSVCTLKLCPARGKCYYHQSGSYEFELKLRAKEGENELRMMQQTPRCPASTAENLRRQFGRPNSSNWT